MIISKSEYMLYLKHPGMLWLKKHDKTKLPVASESLQAMFDDGHLFEEYASKLYPGAVSIGFSDYQSYISMTTRTKIALESDAKTIVQGRLEAGHITCIFDVLEKVPDNKYILTEIKSSTEVKDDHISDLAFQTCVIEDAGLQISQIFVLYVNKEYVRCGEINVSEITKKTDVTTRVREIIHETRENIAKALLVAKSKTPPDMSPRHAKQGALQEWMDIYHNLYPITHSHPIHKLARITPKLMGELEDAGIERIQDIPEATSLNEKQKLQVHVTKHNKRIVKKEKIEEFLGSLTYPLYFFDYETFGSVIPPFDGLRPYQQVPFQYSLHKINSPDASIEHFEYLHSENTHPGLPLLQKLKEDIGEKGSVIVWYEPFEKTRNEELGQMFPEYADFMKQLNDRVVDLMTPFANHWYIDKDFFGSASIKKVMPVLIKDLSYKMLNIQDGSTASRIWSETFLDGKNKGEKNKILKDLHDYCYLDTRAMVELYNFLNSESSLTA